MKPVTKLAGSGREEGGLVTWGADGGLRGRSAGWTSEPETFFVAFLFFKQTTAGRGEAYTVTDTDFAEPYTHNNNTDVDHMNVKS